MPLLPGYSLMLGMLALLGFFALAAGLDKLPEFAAGFKAYGNNFAVPALFLHHFPSWFVGIAFAAIGIGALVPSAIMSIAAPRADPSEQDMCRYVQPYGFVVQVDATALQEGRPSVNLYRFADRGRPAGTFRAFSDLLNWLMQQKTTGS